VGESSKQVVKVGCSPHFRQGGDIGFGELVFPWGHTKHLDTLKQVNDPGV
jgi:hypothetical protein